MSGHIEMAAEEKPQEEQDFIRESSLGGMEENKKKFLGKFDKRLNSQEFNKTTQIKISGFMALKTP